MSLSTFQVEKYAQDLIELSNTEKEDIISEIHEIITPHLKKSGYIDQSHYVNGLLPEGKEERYLQIAEFLSELYIPSVLVERDAMLEHFSDKDHTIRTNFICKDGLYLDFGSFSDFYSHSMDTLKVILAQLRNMKFK